MFFVPLQLVRSTEQHVTAMPHRKIQVTKIYNVLAPPLDMSEAAAAPAVGTIPVELPGLERCSSLQHVHGPA